MAAVCRAFRMSPAEYWDLTVAEHRALVDRLNEEAKGGKR